MLLLVNLQYNKKFSSFCMILKITIWLTLGCYSGSPSPFDTYDTYVHFFCFIKHLYLTLSKYLPKFLIWSLLVYKISLIHISIIPRQVHGKSNWGLMQWPMCLLMNTVSCTMIKLRNWPAICQWSQNPTTIKLDSQFPSATVFSVS